MAPVDGEMPDLFEYAAQKARKAEEEAVPADRGPDHAAADAPPHSADAPPHSADAPPHSADNDKPREKRAGSRAAPLSVSQLVRRSARALERAIGTFWIEGEVVGLSKASSGHFYFTLADKRSQVRAVMWRRDAAKLRFNLEDGLVVRCRGQVNIYEQGGKFQLYVGFAEPAGLGADALALEQLKKKLADEGLFDRERKQAVPTMPRRVGVVTSKSGAAIGDITRTIERRFPVPVLLADTAVQGSGAAGQIVRALRAIAQCDIDVIIVGRGGGSSSDLAVWNDERVVRAVAACPIPTISAVGHEVDISLCDLVADVRAATPTAAAELAVPVRAELRDKLEKATRRMAREIKLRIDSARQELDTAITGVVGLEQKLLARRRTELARLEKALREQHPQAQILRQRGLIGELEQDLRRSFDARRGRADRDFSALVGRLSALSPLNVLERGYSIVRTEGGRIITDAQACGPGDALDVRLHRGSLSCTVTERQTRDDEQTEDE